MEVTRARFVLETATGSEESRRDVYACEYIYIQNVKRSRLRQLPLLQTDLQNRNMSIRWHKKTLLPCPIQHEIDIQDFKVSLVKIKGRPRLAP